MSRMLGPMSMSPAVTQRAGAIRASRVRELRQEEQRAHSHELSCDPPAKAGPALRSFSLAFSASAMEVLTPSLPMGFPAIDVGKATSGGFGIS